ncbi:MAG: hypothetical protein K8S97_12060 [Anaerolineae bacterium]|nr:hypothetical protein [Anaerolineae bacterium]
MSISPTPTSTPATTPLPAPTTAKRWHIAAWSPLAWLETVIKLVALIAALIALGDALRVGDFALPSGARLIQQVILTVLALGLTAAIIDRIIEREIIALVFTLINNAGHWGMVIAQASVEDVGLTLMVFAALMLAGDLVKLLFFTVHTDFVVRDTTRRVLYILTSIWAAGYALLLVIEVVR